MGLGPRGHTTGGYPPGPRRIQGTIGACTDGPYRRGYRRGDPPGFARGYHIGAGLEPTYPDNEPDDFPLVYPIKQA